MNNDSLENTNNCILSDNNSLNAFLPDEKDESALDEGFIIKISNNIANVRKDKNDINKPLINTEEVFGKSIEDL